VIVQFIDTVTLLNSEVRKRFNFETSCGPASYIEGIGGDIDLFGGYMPIYENNGTGGYFCITENDIPLWNGPCEYFFVGLNSSIKESAIKISPNPASSVITIKTLVKGQLTILAINGRKLLQQQITRPVTMVDISTLKEGVYFVRMIGEKGVQVEKIFKN
jgi:hypothetical protein